MDRLASSSNSKIIPFQKVVCLAKDVAELEDGGVGWRLGYRW